MCISLLHNRVCAFHLSVCIELRGNGPAGPKCVSGNSKIFGVSHPQDTKMDCFNEEINNVCSTGHAY